MNTFEKIISVIALTIVLHACENKCDVQTDIDTLRTQRNALEKTNSDLNDQKTRKISEIADLNEKLKELKIYESGKTPKYILTLHFTPTTLRITNVAINSFYVDIPVDKIFYETHNIGESVGRLRIENKHVE